MASPLPTRPSTRTRRTYDSATGPSPSHSPESSPPHQRARFTSSPPPLPNKPTRSSSMDSMYTDRTDQPQFHYGAHPPVPPNAFNIMHEWEIESLEKWQHRLEQVRQNQALLRARINSLVREERDLWTKYDSVSSSTAAGSSSSSSHPGLSRSSSSASTASGSSGRKRGGRAPAGEYAEWVAYLETEVMHLREELAMTVEAEEKAEKGVRKATLRLEEIRVLGDRWRTSPTPAPPSQSNTRSRSSSSSSVDPPQPRSSTPAPDSHHHRSSSTRRPAHPSRSSSSTAPRVHTSFPDPSFSPPKPSRSSSSARPSRSNSNPSTQTYTFTFNTSTATPPSPSIPLPPQTHHTHHTPSTQRGRPLRPSSQKTSIDPWLSYEDKWHQLLTSSSSNPSVAPIVLSFASVPWPMFSLPNAPGDIKVEAVKSFLFSPHAVHRASTRPILSEEANANGNGANGVKSRRAILRGAILRWHPDKFLGRFLGLVDERERETVRQGVEMVMRCLNEIMRMEAAKERVL